MAHGRKHSQYVRWFAIGTDLAGAMRNSKYWYGSAAMDISRECVWCALRVV